MIIHNVLESAIRARYQWLVLDLLERVLRFLEGPWYVLKLFLLAAIRMENGAFVERALKAEFDAMILVDCLAEASLSMQTKFVVSIAKYIQDSLTRDLEVDSGPLEPNTQAKINETVYQLDLIFGRNSEAGADALPTTQALLPLYATCKRLSTASAPKASNKLYYNVTESGPVWFYTCPGANRDCNCHQEKHFALNSGKLLESVTGILSKMISALPTTTVPTSTKDEVMVTVTVTVHTTMPAGDNV
jgi:hypothetical protein